MTPVNQRKNIICYGLLKAFLISKQLKRIKQINCYRMNLFKYEFLFIRFESNYRKRRLPSDKSVRSFSFVYSSGKPAKTLRIIMQKNSLLVACRHSRCCHTFNPTIHSVCRKPSNFSFILSNVAVDIVKVQINAIRFIYFEADVRTFEIRIFA